MAPTAPAISPAIGMFLVTIPAVCFTLVAKPLTLFPVMSSSPDATLPTVLAALPTVC